MDSRYKSNPEVLTIIKNVKVLNNVIFYHHANDNSMIRYFDSYTNKLEEDSCLITFQLDPKNDWIVWSQGKCHNLVKKQISRSSLSSFYMTLQDAKKLDVGNQLDHLDSAGRFVLATVIEKKDDKLKLHYNGWSTEWDTWTDIKKEIGKFAKPGTISKRSAHRFGYLKNGDFVEFNPRTGKYPGWTTGRIRRFDDDLGQIQVCYGVKDKLFHLYWVHLDDEEEVDKPMLSFADAYCRLNSKLT